MLDIAKFYDSINLDILERKIRAHVDRQNYPAVDLLFVLLRFWNRSLEGYGAKSVGLPLEEIGDNSRILANFYLAEYDETLVSFGESFQPGGKYLRYADDQILMASEMDQAEETLFRAGVELRATGNRHHVSRRVVGRPGHRYRDRARWIRHRVTTMAAVRNREKSTTDRAFSGQRRILP